LGDWARTIESNEAATGRMAKCMAKVVGERIDKSKELDGIN
jgi:hypothetical protein